MADIRPEIDQLNQFAELALEELRPHLVRNRSSLRYTRQVAQHRGLIRVRELGGVRNIYIGKQYLLFGRNLYKAMKADGAPEKIKKFGQAASYYRIMTGILKTIKRKTKGKRPGDT